MFIGREEELNFLVDRYNSADGQLVVLYGRRRVGKTELLRQFCQDKEHIFYTCTEIIDEKQLEAFSQRLLEKNQQAAKYITRFSDWEQALLSITELAKDKKIVVVIDEFPYMVKGNNAIPSILQKLWDEVLKQSNVMLILCGSAMSFIEKEVLAEKNPLYGRATGILKMQAMDFYSAQQFFPNYSIEDKITAYAILGGIPHYLKQFSDKYSLDENIVRNILIRGSVLYSEVEFLMRQELRETSVYNAVIEAVALGNTQLNDIYQKTQIDKSKLSVYLKIFWNWEFYVGSFLWMLILRSKLIHREAYTRLPTISSVFGMPLCSRIYLSWNQAMQEEFINMLSSLSWSVLHHMYSKMFVSNIYVSRTENTVYRFILPRLAAGGTRLMR